MVRTTRVQGAVIQDTSVLLIQHREHAHGRTYWLLPGGSAENGETEETALRREISEETHLTVVVERLLFDDSSATDPVYVRFKTFLCRPEAGVARPGAEPEADIATVYTITDVMWLDLRSETTWDASIRVDRWTYPLLKRIQAALGYSAAMP